jgi:putative oxidoreductase
MVIGRHVNKYKEGIYVIFRISLGTLFFMLGMQKIFGIWGMPGGPAASLTLVWFAGIFELMIGSALMFGVLTRLAAFFGVIMMLVAYYIGHVTSGGWNPAQNMGMAALVFGLAFLMAFVHGAGRLSLERSVLGKEIF